MCRQTLCKSGKKSLLHDGYLSRIWRRRSGFTVIELMVVVALATILLALALPSFSSLVNRWRVHRAISELQGIMRFANASAIRTRSHVVIVARPATSCRSQKNTQDWSCGVTVFQDINQNNVRDAGEPVLREVQEFHGLTVMHAGGNNAYLVYGSHGAPIANPSHFEVYPTKKPDPAATQTICLSLGGRMRVKSGAGC